MPRKPRIEYEGAIYHILNRGNYKDDVFCVRDAGQMFEDILIHACGRFGWSLHAYVIMSNHYHLALETPEANLVAGMQWLQSTFGNRFNRLVQTPGHVFQGRYKSLVIEDNGYLLRVVNYIHLNPVRAGIVELDRLRDHALSSYPKFFWKKRPACLSNENWLYLAGNLKPTLAGMRCYEKYLAFCQEQDPKKRNSLHRELCRGWYVGTQAGKKALIQDVAEGNLASNRELEIGRFGADGAELLLQQGLASLGKSVEDLPLSAKTAEWKVVLGCWIKSQSGVTNQWLADHLHMGSMYNVSRVISQEQKRPHGRRKPWKLLRSAKKKT